LSNSAKTQSKELFQLLKWENPQKQKSLIAWYDAQDLSTIKRSKSNSNNIFSINDKSIWGNNITQPDELSQPVLFFDENWAKNGISFQNGGYMVFKFSNVKTIQDITSFVVCKNDIGASKLLYDLSLEDGEGVASCYSGLNSIESRVPNSLVSYSPDFSNNPNKYLILSTRGRAGDIKSSMNEYSYSGSGYRNFQGSVYNRIRLSTKPGDAPSDGVLYELILFDTKLTDDEFAKVKDYLNKKYAIRPNGSINKELQKSSTANSASQKQIAKSNVQSPVKSVSKSPVNQIKKIEVGDTYKGGVIYELYGDGSGGKLFYYTVAGTYQDIQDRVKNEYRNGIKLYMADDYDLQQLFQLGLIGPDAGDGRWTNFWFMGDRRMKSFSYPFSCKAETILNLSSDSNERISSIVRFGYAVDRYSSKCYAASVGYFKF
jgi:hypothetical protein